MPNWAQRFLLVILTAILLAGCGSDSQHDRASVAPDPATPDPSTFIWNAAIPLESAGIGSGPVRVAADSSGNTMAVWLRRDLNKGDSGYYNLYAARCESGSRTWSSATPIEGLPGNINVFDIHKLAALADGSFLAVWEQVGNSNYQAYYNLWNANTGMWSGAREISPTTGYQRYVQLAASPDGRVLAVWVESPDSGVSRHLVGSWFDGQQKSWSEPLRLEDLSGSPQPMFSDQIKETFLPNGDVLVFWPHYDGVQPQLIVNRFRAATGLWDGTLVLANDYIIQSEVILDAAGNLVIAWQTFPGKISTRLLPSGSDNWEPAVTHVDLSSSSSYPPPEESISRPMLFAGVNGERFLAWQQTRSGETRQFLKRWQQQSREWGALEDLGTALFLANDTIYSELLPGTQPTWLFGSSDGWISHIYSQSWDPQSNRLSDPVPLNESTGNAYSLDAVTLPNGEILAVWSQTPPVSFGDSIVVSRFAPPDPEGSPSMPAATDQAAIVTWETAQQIDAGQTFAEDLQLHLDGLDNLHSFWTGYPTTARNSPSLQTQHLEVARDAWTAEPPLVDGTYYYPYKVIPLDQNGLFVVWEQDQQLFSASYNSVSGWSAATALPIAQISYGWDIDIDAAGWLTAIWQEWDGSTYHLFACRRDPASGLWSSPVLLATGGGSFQRVAALPDGSAMAIWTKFGNFVETLHASRFDPQSATWSDPALLASGLVHWTTGELSLLLDGNDRLHLGWVGLAENYCRPFVLHYDLGSGTWSQPSQLDTEPGDTWEKVVLAKGPSGTVVAGWSVVDGDNHRLVVSEFEPATGDWLPAGLLYGSTERFFNLRLAANGRGGLTSAWEQWDGNKSKVVTSTRIKGSSIWSPPSRLNAAGYEAWSPDLGLRPNGELVAIWAQAGEERPSAAIWSSKLRP